MGCTIPPLWQQAADPRGCGYTLRLVRNYQVLRKLSDGSAAEVFLAREASSSDRVLLEVIRSELTTDMEIYGRFLDRAKEGQALVHPHLLRRKSTGCSADGRLFAVTEAVGGDHLGSLLVSRGPLSPAELIRVMAPICDALEYLHQREQVHGNLRPSVVFLTGDPAAPVPKLLDTGLSLFRSSKSAPSRHLVLVEPEYLSPERILGHRGTPLSDVHGLGVLMYELLTGKPPFTSLDPSVTRSRQLEQEPSPLQGAAFALWPLLKRCLAKDPSDRYPSAAAVRDALTAVGKGAAPPPLPPRHTVQMDSRPNDVDVDVEIDLGASAVAEAEVADDSVVGEPLGEVLGSYEVEDLLGQGGMGRVYLARHVRLGRKVALKVLKPELAGDPTQIQRFFQEARAVNRVNHEHIVEIYDFVEERPEAGGRVYCVMELLAGQSLKDLARSAPQPIHRSVRVVRQVCAALQAAHDVGVVHRDIKPDNIFLIERGGRKDFVKVLDFGIAKLRALSNEQSLGTTRVGMVVGTPAFMAPEQALGEVVDHRADIYGLATTLYTLLSGKLPFDAKSFATLVAALVAQAPNPLPAKAASGEPIPPGLIRVVARCLAKKPDDRIQTMAELSAALAPFEETANPTPLPQPVPDVALKLEAHTEPLELAAKRPKPARHPLDRKVQTALRKKSRSWPLMLAAVVALLGAATLGANMLGLFTAPEPIEPTVAQPTPAADAPVAAPVPLTPDDLRKPASKR